MKNATRLALTVLLLPLLLVSCVGLEYPHYWNGNDGLIVNVVTLPFEIVFTPIIFILKILPIV